jgi:hypothetical protein
MRHFIIGCKCCVRGGFSLTNMWQAFLCFCLTIRFRFFCILFYGGVFLFIEDRNWERLIDSVGFGLVRF